MCENENDPFPHQCCFFKYPMFITILLKYVYNISFTREIVTNIKLTFTFIIYIVD